MPINKVSSPTESSHYRPIAILPALSKIFERIVCNQVIDFIERLQIYKDTLTGFRRGFSTGSALLKLRDDIKRAMNASEISIIVLIDFSKAFDTISHDTLIRSLHKMGFSRNFLSWSLSYLSNRKQYVQIDAQQSKPMTTYFGVPQGSILGPLFFNLYVNGLQDSLDSRSIQYADDTTIYESGRPNDIQMITDKLNLSLKNVEQWSNENSLAINAMKTKFLISGSKRLYDRHQIKEKTILLSLGGESIELDEKPRLLGVYLDKHLDWSNHLKELSSSCYGKLSILKKLKHFTTLKLRKQLAESLVLTKIDFNDYVYSPLSVTLINKLQRLQKVAASFVLGRYASSADILKLNWLPIVERREFNCMKMTFKAIHNENWPSINRIEIKKTNRTLRNSNELKLSASMIKDTFQDTAGKLFNKLPTEIREQKSLTSFCTKLRADLTRRAKERLCP